MKSVLFVTIIMFLVSCKSRSNEKKGLYGIEENSTSIVIKKDGVLFGRIEFSDSNNLVFIPAVDTFNHVFLCETGVRSIGRYHNNKPLGKILIFDEYSFPTSVLWYNRNKLYSKITNIKASIGNIHNTIKEGIDTNRIFMPNVFLTQSKEVENRYKLTIYSSSYPVYLMSISYNIINNNDPEYNFINNSFTLLFDRKDIHSDTLSLGFKYLEDFTNEEDRKVIKAVEYKEKINWNSIPY